MLKRANKNHRASAETNNVVGHFGNDEVVACRNAYDDSMAKLITGASCNGASSAAYSIHIIRIRL